jgi:hypothetical protein
MHDPNLNLLLADERRVNDRYRERLKEAEARRLENLARGRHRVRPVPVRLVAQLRRALPVLLRAILNPLRVRRRPGLGAKRAANEP